MHTNYYFLRQLAPALEPHLTGLKFMACFSQDLDEVVLVFAQAKGKTNYYKPFYIKATLRPDFSGLFFPTTIQRARINTADLFESVIGEDGGRLVTGVRAFLNERCIAILLEDDFSLLFNFFGNRPNLLAFRGNDVIDLFNHNLATDEQRKFNAFDRPIDQSYAAYEKVGFDYRKLFPTFGKVINGWISAQLSQQKPQNEIETWAIIQDVRQQLEQPRYFLTSVDHKPTLALLPLGDVQREFDDPVEAANRFYVAFNGLSTFEREKAELWRILQKRQKRANAQIEATLQRLITREEGASHEEIGHILMANLHDIMPTAGSRSPERLTLYDFYRDQPVTLKLKPDLSPQKNAENFYRKAKNDKIEEEHLTSQVTRLEADLLRMQQHQTDIMAIESLKELRRYSKTHGLPGDRNAGSVSTDSGQLFKEVVVDNFRILIGRNAKNNDLLTQKYAYKEDLWLHARDVSGSHVIIKYQSGKTFPKNVIERAAELAAWYSKRRTDSLCPVTVTPKKFVRKPKGLAEGQVIIEKEDVVLVAPKGE